MTKACSVRFVPALEHVAFCDQSMVLQSNTAEDHLISEISQNGKADEPKEL